MPYFCPVDVMCYLFMTYFSANPTAVCIDDSHTAP